MAIERIASHWRIAEVAVVSDRFVSGERIPGASRIYVIVDQVIGKEWPQEVHSEPPEAGSGEKKARVQ